MTRRVTGNNGNGARRHPRPPEPLRHGNLSPRWASARAPAGANPMAADGDPPSPDSLELERADHQRLVPELVRDPVVRLDFSEADDLERRLRLVRLEVERTVDHEFDGLQRLSRLPPW